MAANWDLPLTPAGGGGSASGSAGDYVGSGVDGSIDGSVDGGVGGGVGGGAGVGAGVGGSSLPDAAAPASDLSPDATELARWTRVMTPAPPVAMLPGNPLRDRLDSLPAEERAWLLPCSLWEPAPPASSSTRAGACGGGWGGVGGGGVAPALGPFSPSTFAAAVCRERVMTTTASGVPFLVLAGVTLFLPHAVVAGSGALLGAMVSDWGANRMDAVGPGLPSCVSIVQRGVLAGAGRRMMTSTELGGGTHVLIELARSVAKRGSDDGNVGGGDGGGVVNDGPSIEFEFLVIRRPRAAGEAAALVLHKLGVLHTIPEGGSPHAASAAAGGVVGAAASPPPPPFSSTVTPSSAGAAADAAAIEAQLLTLCADGQHIGALVDMAEPSPPPLTTAGGALVTPPPPQPLPYTVTTSRCSVYASVRLRTLALQLVPLAVPSTRPLGALAAGGREGGGLPPVAAG